MLSSRCKPKVQFGTWHDLNSKGKDLIFDNPAESAMPQWDY